MTSPGIFEIGGLANITCSASKIGDLELLEIFRYDSKHLEPEQLVEAQFSNGTTFETLGTNIIVVHNEATEDNVTLTIMIKKVPCHDVLQETYECKLTLGFDVLSSEMNVILQSKFTRNFLIKTL